MRLAVLGHSMIHIRQRMYFKYIASLGHDVLVIAPGQWGDQRVVNEGAGSYQLVTHRHMGGDNQFDFTFVGLQDTLTAFKPDWVYIQQEPSSRMARQVLEMQFVGFKPKIALFTWENYVPPNVLAQDVLKDCSLVVCGNGEAETLVKPVNPKTLVALQVGVNTDHFQARPDILRKYSVMFAGRFAKEKGLKELEEAWPLYFMLPWTDWLQLPWWLSMAQIVVQYSQDLDAVLSNGTPYHWREQAPNYTSVESMCCGAAVVTSDSGSIPYWLNGGYAEPCPGAVIVPQKNPIALRRVLEDFAGKPDVCTALAQAGREWTVKHLGYAPQAQRLLEAMV